MSRPRSVHGRGVRPDFVGSHTMPMIQSQRTAKKIAILIAILFPFIVLPHFALGATNRNVFLPSDVSSCPSDSIIGDQLIIGLGTGMTGALTEVTLRTFATTTQEVQLGIYKNGSYIGSATTTLGGGFIRYSAWNLNALAIVLVETDVIEVSPYNVIGGGGRVDVMGTSVSNTYGFDLAYDSPPVVACNLVSAWFMTSASASYAELAQALESSSPSGVLAKCGITDISGCITNALSWAFYPTATINIFSNAQPLASTTPFAYLFEVRDIWALVFDQQATSTASTLTIPFSISLPFSATASTSLNAGTLASTISGASPFFAQIRLFIYIVFQFLFAFWIFKLCLHVMGLVGILHAESAIIRGVDRVRERNMISRLP